MARNDFGNWLSGFVDGEGCFDTGLHKNPARWNERPNPAFLETLKRIQSEDA